MLEFRFQLVRGYLPVQKMCKLIIQQVTGRTWRGTAFGGVKGRTEIPGLVDGKRERLAYYLITAHNSEIDYLKGTVKIDEYVTHSRNLSDINEGFHDMHVCC